MYLEFLHNPNKYGFRDSHTEPYNLTPWQARVEFWMFTIKWHETLAGLEVVHIGVSFSRYYA